MRQFTKNFLAPFLMAVLCAPVVLARPQQQQPPPPVKPTQPTQPVPPTTGQDNGQSGAGQQAGEEPVSPIATPTQAVTGGFALPAGRSNELVSRILAGFSVSELYDSNAQNIGVTTGADEFTNISGHFDVHRIRQSSDFSFRYVGGGFLDAQHSQFDSSYHQFELDQMIQFRRWRLRIDDLFSYLPRSPFGFEGGGPQGSTILSYIYQDPNIAPAQTIVTQAGRRLSNELLGEAQVDLSARSAVTFTGGYGYLHFLDPGFLDASEGAFSTGYNYALSRRDTVGFQYNFTDIQFNPVSGTIINDALLASFGHSLSQQLSVKVSVGPQFSQYTPPGATVSQNAVVVDAEADMAYQYNRTALYATFYRGVGGGGGVTVGGIQNVVQLGASQQLGRYWTVRATGGAAYSSSLPQVSPIITRYVEAFATAGITRQFGPRASVFVNYNFLHQTVSPNNVCVGLACAQTFDRHQVWVGFSWDMRPWGLQ